MNNDLIELTFASGKRNKVTTPHHFNTSEYSHLRETDTGMALKVIINMDYPVMIDKSTFLKYPPTPKLVLTET